MATKKKVMTTKLYIAIILVAILAVASAAIVYTTTRTSSSAKPKVVGVQVGDTFTYNLTGASALFDPNAVTPAYLSEYNNTDYYQVTITGINGSIVMFDTEWTFTNGTAPIVTPEWINLATGADSGDFWAIYVANLNVNNLLRPQGYDELIVNSTSTLPYANSTRITNFFSIENVFTDINDPTGSTQQYNYIQAYFDKQTGMLISLTNLQEYNNPSYNIIITWQLTSTNVWTV